MPASRSDVVYKDSVVECRIVKVADEFGNLHTALTQSDLNRLNLKPGNVFTVSFKNETVRPTLGAAYGDVPREAWVALLSTVGPEKGTLEIARNFANAAETLGCKVGDILTISTSGN